MGFTDDTMRLLIIEDDRALADALREALQRRGLACDHASSAADADMMVQAVRYAAALLDLGLPDLDGVELIRRLRARQEVLPILILTARGDLPERLRGLDAGADDYLVKPVDIDELVARIRAVLRRGSFEGQSLQFGNMKFDTGLRSLSVEGADVSLSSREIELIELLLKRAGRVLTRQLAEDQLFGMSETLGSNAIEVYVHRLRRKLEQAGATARIGTIRGVGYLLQLTK